MYAKSQFMNGAILALTLCCPSVYAELDACADKKRRLDSGTD
jgi:hypothetical protein